MHLEINRPVASLGSHGPLGRWIFSPLTRPSILKKSSKVIETNPSNEERFCWEDKEPLVQEVEHQWQHVMAWNMEREGDVISTHYCRGGGCHHLEHGERWCHFGQDNVITNRVMTWLSSTAVQCLVIFGFELVKKSNNTTQILAVARWHTHTTAFEEGITSVSLHDWYITTKARALLLLWNTFWHSLGFFS